MLLANYVTIINILFYEQRKVILFIMAGKIKIEVERCKGCGLCVEVCPNKLIEISQNINKKGYLHAETRGEGCTGCGLCALVCPDVVIEVYHEAGKKTTVDKESL